MITKVVVLLVASSGYQPIEYGVPRMLLEQAGIQVKVASDAKPTAYAQPGSSIYATAHVDYTLDEINPDAIDGLFVIGGPGAL
ncbi:MAG TPA: DJ-1/PfpI family protein, partial [Candidatus Limnocylindria bacterium]|nr:DJ-1/PfpI family protein [Candidatus Limnocylindria bacterium]